VLKYLNFLPDCNNQSLRDELWAGCCRCEGFFSSLGFNGTVAQVNVGNPVFICLPPPHRITIPVDSEDKGVLFHEMTHDLFHHSKFHRNYWPLNAHDNELWGEAFCEAFRFLMELAFTGDSKWLRAFQTERHPPDSDKGRASRIVAKSKESLDGLAALWWHINNEFNQTGNYLSRIFPEA
jgi:hypothetical protein